MNRDLVLRGSVVECIEASNLLGACMCTVIAQATKAACMTCSVIASVGTHLGGRVEVNRGLQALITCNSARIAGESGAGVHPLFWPSVIYIKLG